LLLGGEDGFLIAGRCQTGEGGERERNQNGEEKYFHSRSS